MQEGRYYQFGSRQRRITVFFFPQLIYAIKFGVCCLFDRIFFSWTVCVVGMNVLLILRNSSNWRMLWQSIPLVPMEVSLLPSSLTWQMLYMILILESFIHEIYRML